MGKLCTDREIRIRRGVGEKCVQGSNGILLWGQNASVKHTEIKQIIDKANKIKHGQWGQRSQPGTRMNWIPSVKEATKLVWTDKYTPKRRREHEKKGWEGQPGTQMNWNPTVSKGRK